MNGNIQASVSIDLMAEVRDSAAREGVTVSQWVRETITARITAERLDQADQTATRMKSIQKRYQR